MTRRRRTTRGWPTARISSTRTRHLRLLTWNLQHTNAGDIEDIARALANAFGEDWDVVAMQELGKNDETIITETTQGLAAYIAPSAAGCYSSGFLVHRRLPKGIKRFSSGERWSDLDAAIEVGAVIGSTSPKYPPPPSSDTRSRSSARSSRSWTTDAKADDGSECSWATSMRSSATHSTPRRRRRRPRPKQEQRRQGHRQQRRRRRRRRRPRRLQQQRRRRPKENANDPPNEA